MAGGLLATLALLLNMLVPPGFMVDRGSGHAMRIVICTGQGPVQLRMEASPLHRQHHENDGKASTLCPFAGHTLPALGAPPPPFAGTPDPVTDTVPAALRFAAVPGRGLAAPPPPSHAPPAIRA